MSPAQPPTCACEKPLLRHPLAGLGEPEIAALASAFNFGMRIAYFLGRKRSSELSAKTSAQKIDQSREGLLEKVNRLSSLTR